MIVSFNPLRKGSSPAVAQPSINKFLWPAPECCRFFTKLEAVSSYLLNITREGGGGSNNCAETEVICKVLVGNNLAVCSQ